MGTDGFDDRVMHRLLEDRVRRDGDKVFVTNGADQATYRMIDDASSRIANFLIDRLGVEKFDNVGVLMPNCIDFLRVQFGISKTGAVMVPINVLAKLDLLSHFLNSSDVEILIVDAQFLPSVAEIADRIPKLRALVVRTTDREILRSAAKTGLDIVPFAEMSDASTSRPDIQVSWNDPVDIFFTSGTTGVSKGVVLAHNHHFVFGNSVIDAGRLGEDDIMYVTLPLHHGIGSYMSIMPMLLCGGTIALGDAFSASGWLDEIRAYGATATWAVSSMTPILMKQPARHDDADNPLRTYLYIGMTADLLVPFERRFGVRAIDNYGSTEAGLIAYSRWDERRPGAVGPINSHLYEVAIVDEHDREVPVGEAGECVSRCREPFTQMVTYYGMAEATVETFRNRWLHSGDLCRVDEDGWIYFLGRGKDTIRRRGENISCFELESILAGCDGVLECTSIAVPSEIGEDEIKVVVASRGGNVLGPDQIIAYCRDNMPRYMVPRYVELVGELPKLPNLKVDKQILQKAGLTLETWDVTTGTFVEEPALS